MEELRDAHVLPESLKGPLKENAMNRKPEAEFLRSALMDCKYLAVDMTHVLSISGSAICMQLDHESMREFRPHV